MANLSRRQFIGTAIAGAASAIAAPGILDAAPTGKRSATDWVPLGKTGLKIPRLGMGTGSIGGRVQRDLGQKGLDRLVRYAYDQGVRYFDTAQNYRIHGMLGKALKGLPRENIFIQSKVPWNKRRDAGKAVDEYRKELDTDYIDSVLLHCVTTPGWVSDLARMQDELSDKKSRQHIRGHGASAHGIPGLTGLTRCDWAEVNLCRLNPQGKHVDGAAGKWDEPGNVPAAVEGIRKIHEAGRGVIAMKLIGNGSFTDARDREKAIQFVMKQDFVDAVVIGFKSPAEIDEAIERINRALNS